jgi:hypothetical protein
MRKNRTPNPATRIAEITKAVEGEENSLTKPRELMDLGAPVNTRF